MLEYPDVRSIRLGAFVVTLFLLLELMKFSVAGLSSTTMLLLRQKDLCGDYSTSLNEFVDYTDALLFLCVDVDGRTV